MKIPPNNGRLFATLTMLMGYLFCSMVCGAHSVSLVPLLSEIDTASIPKVLHYSFPEYGFSIDSPTKLFATSPYKSGSLLIYEYNGELPNKANIGVYFYHLPDELHDEITIKKAMDDLQDSFVGNDFRDITTRSIHLDGAYARDVFYSIPETEKPTGRGHSRLIIYKNTVYVLSIVMPEPEYSSGAFSSFFNSFTILKVKR